MPENAFQERRGEADGDRLPMQQRQTYYLADELKIGNMSVVDSRRWRGLQRPATIIGAEQVDLWVCEFSALSTRRTHVSAQPESSKRPRLGM